MHCIVLYVNGNSVTHFKSFRVEYISKEIKKSDAIFIFKTISMLLNRFIDFMFNGKSLADFTTLF